MVRKGIFVKKAFECPQHMSLRSYYFFFFLPASLGRSRLTRELSCSSSCSWDQKVTLVDIFAKFMKPWRLWNSKIFYSKKCYIKYVILVVSFVGPKGSHFLHHTFLSKILLIYRCEGLVCQLDPKGHTFCFAILWAKFLLIYSCEGLVCQLDPKGHTFYVTLFWALIWKPVICKIHFTCSFWKAWASN